MNKINQRGAISAVLITVVGLFTLLLLIIGVFVGMYVSAGNYAAQTEIALKAVEKNNENIYANGTQKVMEIASVPAMYRDDLQKVITAEIQNKYGASGSQATVQFFKDRSITLDPSMYKEIQNQVIIFRNQFEQAQQGLIDKKRAYQSALVTFPKSFFLSMAGYPKMDLDALDIVTTDKARDTFRTHRDSGIQFGTPAASH